MAAGLWTGSRRGGRMGGEKGCLTGRKGGAAGRMWARANSGGGESAGPVAAGQVTAARRRWRSSRNSPLASTSRSASTASQRST